ncbi:hypothetical protein [Streptomyces collinus]|uniref:hypothetical protein n=1 Tax=Streptomyces collinus TaxID=42684 RepID=UPI002943F303|nr:hypothetical protein [Streptomyces collinus]
MSKRTDGGEPDERRPHERHEPDVGHEPTHEQEHTQSHAGNGTVNHGPDEKGPEGLGPGLDGLASDELDLRRMLQSAVDDIEPRTGTLDHLRRAVPARRARKRQAAVGMVAAALFIGTAIPALIHVSNSGGTDPNTAMAGQSSEAQGGATQGKDPDGGADSAGGTPGKTAGPGRNTGKPGKQGGTGGNGTGSTSGANPSVSAAADAPPCTAAQLGSATQSVGAPDSTGVVYGTFHLTNTSATACTVGGAGTVGVTAQGAADSAKIGSARHVSGDPAAGLPDPSVEVATLVLQPGAAYEEKFAFVPSETCPTTGGPTDGGSDTGGPSPDPSPTPDPGAAGSGGGTDTAGTTGVTTQLGTEDGGPADGSVLVTHTAQAGTTLSATVGNACAGTVYYTGMLAGA